MSGEKPDKSYEVESSQEHEPPAIRALDVCPNCGSNLGSIDSVVCLRCGFDLKTLKVIKTATGKAAEKKEEAAEEEEEAEPLVSPGRGDLWLPGLVAAAAIGVLAVAYLAGWGGLFGPEATIGFGTRVAGLVKMATRTAVWTLAGMGGLIVLAHMLKTRLGDRRLAAVRMLAVVGAVSLATMINIPSQGLEWAVQLALQAAGFVAVSMGFFGLNVRDASTLLGVAVMAGVALLLVSSAVWWAAWPV